MALILILLIALIGGGTGVLSKIALREIPPLSFTFLRFLISSFFMIPLILKEKKKLSRKEIIELFIVSLLAVGNVTFFAFGVRFTSATVAQTLYAMVPVVSLVLSYFILNEKITQYKIWGILLGLIGTLIIILIPAFNNQLSFQNSLKGNLLILLGLTSFSFYSIFSKKLQKRFSPIYLTTSFIVTTTIIQLFLSISDFSLHPNWWQNVTAATIFSTLYVAIFSTVLYYAFYQYAIKHASPVIASLTLYLQPAATFVWAAILLKEKLTFSLVFGGILILLSARITTYNFGKAT